MGEGGLKTYLHWDGPRGNMEVRSAESGVLEVKGQVCLAGLKVLGEYLEGGLGIHGCQIQCLEV